MTKVAADSWNLQAGILLILFSFYIVLTHEHSKGFRSEIVEIELFFNKRTEKSVFFPIPISMND